MRVLLVGPDFEENLSIRYLSAALLEAGHETTLAAFNSSSDENSVLLAARDADIVGLSMCFQSRAREFLHLAQSIKSAYPQRPVFAGGHYASCAAAELLGHHHELDVIVIHEGERAIVELAAAVASAEPVLSSVLGIAYRDGHTVNFTPSRPTIDNLDSLPFPDRRGPVRRIAGVPTSFVMGSRGCYGNCAYCCITTLHRMAPGKRFRQRSCESIADEMATLYFERGSRQFIFHDDNFLVPSETKNHERLSLLERSLATRKVHDIAFVIKCRPSDATESVLEHLKDMGLVRIFLGVESATSQGLTSLQREQSVEESERALQSCTRLGISAQFTLMTFNPDATLATLRADIAFMRRHCENPLNFCRAEIYTGTPLEQRMRALGRAKGDYLARVYRLSDPEADLACSRSLAIFGARCWSSNSLMQNAIGLDHLAAVAARFHRRPRQREICDRAGNWLRRVNLDTIGLLEEVIDLSSGRTAEREPVSPHALRDIERRELNSRRELFSEARRLRAELNGLSTGNAINVAAARRALARQAAAAIIAVGLPTASGMQAAFAQDTRPATPASQSQANSLASLTGTVVDPAGAVVARAKVTITNLDQGKKQVLRTNEVGQYTATGLSAGRYSLRVQSPGFITRKIPLLELQKGVQKRLDIKLEIDSLGCCEYAAAPLQYTEDLLHKKKPFDYTVGDQKDHNTLQGIAQLVYGDSNMWLQIFEANESVISELGEIPTGTNLTIPVRDRNIPKLISKVLPVYPPDVLPKQVNGPVVVNVFLKDDGTVDHVEFVDGPEALAQTAIEAVKLWRYQVPANKTVRRSFFVALTFEKNGKVR